MRMRRIFAALTAGVAAVAGIVVMPATPASAASYTAYVSILTPSGYIGPSVIDIKDGSMGTGAIAQLWLLRIGNNVSNQRWHIERVTNLSAPFGKFKFTNAKSGMCLTGKVLPGDTTVRQFPCSDSDTQWWRAVRVSSVNGNWVELVNVHHGTCLDARGYAYGDGVVLQTYACHGGWNQRFNPYP